MRNRNTPKPKDLPIQTLNSIQQLFLTKGWPFNGYLGEEYFNDFCKMIQPLSEDQQKMMLSLTQDFLWVQETEYIKYFVPAFDLLNNYIGNAIRRTIVIAPLLPPDDFGKSKSSVSLLYHIKSCIAPIQQKYNMHNICLLECPATFDITNFPPNALFCLVDDFIGSGRTAVNAAQYYLNKGVATNNLAVVGLVSMCQGIDCLRQHDIHVFSGVIRQKAISDRTDGNKEVFFELMKAIEAKIKVREKYTFGYSQSEGLVKMMRTPNNTFPIYWLKNTQNKTPPFPR